MAETETTEDLEKTTKEAQDAFSAGFKEASPPALVTAPTGNSVAEATPEHAEAVDSQADRPSEPPAPEIVQLTKENYDLLRAGVDDIAALKQQLSKAFGTIGTVQEQLGQLRGQKGGRIKFKKEAFARLTENYPELAADILNGLEENEVDATPSSPPPSAVDPARLAERVKADLIEEQKKRELKLLDHLEPGWTKIVGGPNDNNAFRRWFQAQPEAYREYVENSTSAATTKACIDRFRAATRKPAQNTRPAAPQGAVRTDRLREAIPPRGSSTAPAPATRTIQDSFREGFRKASSG